MRLQGKVALVTGAGRGIGRAVALRYAEEGADVAIVDHALGPNTEEVVGSIRALGRQGEAIRADVSRVEEVRRMVPEAVARLGRLDVLVNNAGVESHADFWDVTEADYDRVMDVNLKGAFFGTQAYVRHLRAARQPGKVINMSSVHEDLPFPHFAAYCLSKGGMRMLTRTLAVELGPLGITVNGIAPGAVATPINADLFKDAEKVRALTGHIPLGRIAQPEDVAGLAAFLASADADYVTGATYFIDGGLSKSYEEQ